MSDRDEVEWFLSQLLFAVDTALKYDSGGKFCEMSYFKILSFFFSNEKKNVNMSLKIEEVMHFLLVEQ